MGAHDIRVLHHVGIAHSGRVKIAILRLGCRHLRLFILLWYRWTILLVKIKSFFERIADATLVLSKVALYDFSLKTE